MSKKTVIIGSIYVIILVIIELFVGKYHTNEPVDVQYNDETVNLRFVCATGDLAGVAVIENVISRFEDENPQINVELVFNESDLLYEEYIMKLSATGKLGDIVEIRQTQFFDSGYIATLPESLSSKTENKYEIAGKAYGINYYITTDGIIYNKQIFRMLGISEPTNYKEFIEICDELAIMGYTPIAVGGGDIWHMKFWLNHFYLNDVLLSNPNWEEELKNGKVSWLNEEARTMFTHLYELFNSGYIDEDWRIDKDSIMASKIASEKAVMLYSGTWMVNQIKDQNPNIELGWFFVPNDEGDTLVRDISDGYFAITNECATNSKKYDAAVKFLEFFFSEPIYPEICNKMGAISSIKNITSDSDEEHIKLLESKFYEEEKHTRFFLGDENYPNSFQKNVLSAVISLINNEITIDEALKICDEAYISASVKEGIE